ncbi:efflux RND transporter permease subunit [Boseongicola aestuarii]|uniref:Putative efflux pump membrane transporter TtgB n=1 Tax=Boseongicola aestuarii TaxID=1470561 RepID=A0A238IYT3_9RHOB|nr:efflux RND transporter permease subunit [Boseongicola aestuarii]SMX23183.1 putative efflux pump membrane transporter TtgB [Boseongicola aestuarii]
MARDLGKAAGGILSYFTRHKTAANLLLVLLLMAGLYSIPKMRAQFFPDIITDNITIQVAWDGAGAEDVDTGIVQVLEPALQAVDGVIETSSRSSEGSARITMEFEPDWDMDRAEDDVNTALDGVTNLPDDAEDPSIRRSRWSDRVTDVVITGPVGVDQLANFADEFVTRLFAEGVTRTTIRGLAAPQTIVEVTSLDLIRFDVSMREISAAISGEVETDPAGDVSGAARVRTGVAKRSADQIAGIVIRTGDDGTQVTVGDVATVRVEGVDRNRAYFVGENPAISIRVDRSAQGDAIRMQAQVEDVAAEMELSLPEGVRIDLIRTLSETITARLNILLDNGLMGLGLVVLLLFLFLNARTAFWVAAGIPVAIIAAISIMYFAGLTLNMISLFALIITLGIVVDDAIVVGEHADFRARRLGEDPTTAAERAANRMFTPVFSATITTIIAFFALVAVGGRFGDLISDIPFTVIVVLIASLIECFLILPNHMRHAVAHAAKDHWYDWPSRQVNRGFRVFRERIFRPMMAGVIWARYPVIAGAILLLASQAVLFIRGDVQWRFFNSPEQGSVTANFAMVPGATRADTFEVMRRLQATVDEIGAEFEEEHGVNPVAYAIAEVGGTSGRGLAGEETKETFQLGSIAVELIDADSRPYSSFTFVSALQEAMPQHPMLETISFRGWRGGPGGDAIDIELSGASSEQLKSAAEALKTQLAQYGEVSALEDNLTYDKEEIVLELTPQGQALGLTIDDLGQVLRARLNGIEAASFPDGPRSATIRVELPEGELTADFLDRLLVRTGSAAPGDGVYVPLADIVTVESRTGFSTIRRENGIRVVSVTGDLSEDDPARAEEISTEISEVILPKLQEDFGISTRMAGLAEDERNFLSDAMTGLILCLAGIYLTLAWVFSSWSRPVVVMAIIPFGLVGTIWGHYIWDVPLSMFSVVGMIGMVGIVINDSIVLVTTIDEYGEDRGLFPAIIDGAADRLRAVILTTLTTVLGLAPLLYETSNQAQFLKPTVITLVYGLGFGMVLVLLVVPALLAIGHDFGRTFRAARRALSGRAPGMQVVLGGVGAGIVAWFGATMGSVIVTGAMPAALGGSGSMALAFFAFVGGAAAIVFSGWGLAALRFARRLRV